MAAEKAFQRAAELSDTHDQKNQLLLMAAYAAQRYREVVERSQHLNPEIPYSLSFYMCLAQAHVHLGEYEEALAASTQALATARIGRADSANQPAFHIHMQLADIYVKLHMFREALAHLDQAFKLAPFRWYAHSRRAYVHFELRNYPATLADLRKAIELNPADLSALTWISIERIAACPNEAFRRGFLAFLDRAVELNNQSPASLRARAKCQMFLGNPTQAWPDLKSAFAQDQSAYEHHYETALLSLKVADRDFYTSTCRKMLDQFANSEDVQARQYTAWTCALAPNALNDYTQLIALCRASAAKDPTSLQFVNDLGAVLMRAGQYPEARQWLEQSLTMTGNAKPLPTYSIYLLAMTEYHLGNKEAAQRQMQSANILADKELNGSPRWNRRLTIELLKAEAFALIDKPANAPAVVDATDPSAQEQPAKPSKE